MCQTKRIMKRFLKLVKKIIFNYKYIVVSDFIKGKDKRCNKSTNLYVGVNNLNEYQIATLLRDAYDLTVSIDVIKRKIDELNNSSFSNKMITVNMFHYRDDYARHNDLGSIIIGNNGRKGIHHTLEFDYIDAIVVDNKIVINN